MKFLLFTISALSTVFMVHSATIPEVDQDLLNPSNIIILCQSEDKAKTCKSSMLADVNEYSFLVNGILNGNAIEAEFLGGCTKANEALKNLTGCGLQNCDIASCEPSQAQDVYNYQPSFRSQQAD